MMWRRRKCFCKNNSLVDLETGAITTVIDLCKDRDYRNRIISLGIRIGTEVEVLKKIYSEHGCMIIKVNGSRLVLNSELARRIKISPNSSNI